MSTDLTGKSVLVTGASIGIGRETALRFAAAGCRVALTYFEHRAEAEEVVQRCLGLGAPDAFAVSLQLADEDSICTLLERVIDRFGALDILVNNAGVISWKPFLEQDFGELDAQVNVNLLGVMKLTWCFLPLVTRRGDHRRQHRDAAPVAHAAAVLRDQVGPARLRQGAGAGAPGQADRERAPHGDGDAHERHAGHVAGARRRRRSSGSPPGRSRWSPAATSTCATSPDE